jgi:NitT/TauT family transport system ATP-binding protein
MSVLSVDIDRKRFASPGSDERRVVLADLRLALAEGELLCLVGPSGCGKSTLLNIINGLDQEVEGRVTLSEGVHGGDVATVFQNPRLMPWLTVLDNVCLVLNGSTAAETQARNLLAEMGLGDVLDVYPNRLSGGMQRRVALARAFAIEPRLLLMDEPFVSLDMPAANRLRAMLIELWRIRRTTVLFVTHDLREALALADRVLFMSASPGSVVLEQRVDLPRPRSLNGDGVIALQERLLADHPDLLRGLIGTG